MNRRLFAKSLALALVSLGLGRNVSGQDTPAQPSYKSELVDADIVINGDGYTEQTFFWGTEEIDGMTIEQYMFNRDGEGNAKIWFIENSNGAEDVIELRKESFKKDTKLYEGQSEELEQGTWWTGGMTLLDLKMGLYGEYIPKAFGEIDLYVEWGSNIETFDQNLKEFNEEITVGDRELFTLVKESKVGEKSYDGMFDD